ncbi:MAG: PIN domain-containing protein [Defluviitaleaceae bacterium]|nr:PIN domain-containing protein [Defluviitaleaceae bacterium]
MILVDTSVIFQFLKGENNKKTALLERIIARDIPYGIATYTFQELLQGTRSENEFITLKMYLATQTVYYLPQSTQTYEAAASMYLNLRREGIEPKSTIDILIALTAIKNDLMLLHNDKDFDALVEKIDALRSVENL